MAGEAATTRAEGRREGEHSSDAATRGKIDPKASSLRFVYPFVFAPGEFDSRLPAVEAMTWNPDGPFPVWTRFAMPTDDLLTYVASFVNPPESGPISARFWTLSGKALQSASGLAAGAGHSVASWNLFIPRAEIAFALEGAQLALFRDGVGFLTFDTRPSSSYLNDWLDFLHYFRFSRGQRQVGLRLERTGFDPDTRKQTRTPFFPEPAGGSSRDGGKGQLDHLVDALLGGTVAARWWDDVFVPGQLLPYATIYVDGLSETDAPTLVYRMRNFFHSRQQLAPAEAELRLEQPTVLPYADRQWFTFSLDGGSFVAVDAPNTPFFRQLMPQHLAIQYYLLFLLALEQRFTLLRLTHEVARNWFPRDGSASDGARAQAFARIRDALLAFTAQGYFAQVMQQEHHHRCYRRWQEIFQVARLYEEVGSEVREMHSYLDLRYRQASEEAARKQEESARRVEHRLALITWLLGSPTLIFVFLAAVPGLDTLKLTFLDERPVLKIGATFLLGLLGLLFGLVGYLILERELNRRKG